MQTARSLLKGLVAVKGGKQARGNGAYLNEVRIEAGRRCHVRSPKDWFQPETQVAALRCAAATSQQSRDFSPVYSATGMHQLEWPSPAKDLSTDKHRMHMLSISLGFCSGGLGLEPGRPLPSCSLTGRLQDLVSKHQTLHHCHVPGPDDR